MTILVTGGLGFIGSAVVRHLIHETDHRVVTLDAETYAASRDALEDALAHPRHELVVGDIRDAGLVRALLAEHRPRAIMHLAAESHVDRSIDGPADFISTNVVGTLTLLEAVRDALKTLPADFVFHHVSTDEVFGHLHPGDPPFTEESPYAPRSPYAASKAASDHLVRAWHATYGLPAFVTNTCNNFGPWQFPEKLIPLTIANALEGKTLPVYGKGENIRDWIFVEDHAAALVRALKRARPGETWCLGAASERRNIEVVHAICDIVDRLAPDPEGPRRRLIRFVSDRPGHDFRYAIDPMRAMAALDWHPSETFLTGLDKTVRWYIANRGWWEGIRAQRYAGQRLGQAETAPPAAQVAP
jgi:dTDP-glucose 4,6-dehydratase